MREVRQAEAPRIAALRRAFGRRRPARRHGAPLGSVTAAVDAAPPYMWAVGGSVLASPGGRRLVSLGVERRDWPGSAATTPTRRVPGGWGWRAALSKSDPSAAISCGSPASCVQERPGRLTRARTGGIGAIGSGHGHHDAGWTAASRCWGIPRQRPRGGLRQREARAGVGAPDYDTAFASVSSRQDSWWA